MSVSPYIARPSLRTLALAVRLLFMGIILGFFMPLNMLCAFAGYLLLSASPRRLATWPYTHVHPLLVDPPPPHPPTLPEETEPVGRS